MINYIHHYWAFVVSILLFITFGKYALDMRFHKKFDFNLHFRLASFTLIAYYIQLILGILNWFFSDYFQSIKAGHMGVLMKTSYDRLRVVEHPFLMIMGILLLHYGFNRMKKAQTDKKRYMPILIFYGINILFVLFLVAKGLFQ